MTVFFLGVLGAMAQMIELTPTWMIEYLDKNGPHLAVYNWYETGTLEDRPSIKLLGEGWGFTTGTS